MKQLSMIVIGAGCRGTAYSKIALSQSNKEKFKIVGVAEPIDIRREYLKNLCSIPDADCYKDWKEILAKPRMADVAIISTMDYMHFEPAMAAIEKGYNILLEKPAAPTPYECAEIAKAAHRKNVKVIVCHVLRYTPFFELIKSIIDNGKIGRVQSVVYSEAVGNVHQSHSYVRGRWHSVSETAPMLLTKSCHDIDMLQWLIGKKCSNIQSFGSLTYFNSDNAPKDAPERCIDGCPHGETCPYNAVRLYFDDKKNIWFRSSATDTVKPTDDEVEKALRTNNYGKCVFRCDNDVVDHQVVNMEFEDGATVSYSMNPFNKGGRYVNIFGTSGEISAHMSDTEINVYTFEDKKTEKIPVVAPGETIVSGHGGGDQGIILALYDYLNGNYTCEEIADITESVENHLLVFAAEKSRRENCVVDTKKYISQYGI